MRKLLFGLLVVGLVFGSFGCAKKGDKGDTGPQGAQGDPANFQVLTGYIPASGILSIGSGSLPADAHVTVWYALPGYQNIWIELGEPDSAGTNPWCAVNYDFSYVYFYNCFTSWSYKIVVIKSVSTLPLMDRLFLRF